MSVGEIARDTIFGLVSAFSVAPPALGSELSGGLPKDIVADLDAVLADTRISYRDGLMIQLAYGNADPQLDLTKRPPGARSVAKQLGDFLAEKHIRSVKDAYQNIAKNTVVLNRGNVEEFDRILCWANEASVTQRDTALRYVCAIVAATARPVRPMPRLNRSGLTYAPVVNLFHGLMANPSGGAFEQFTVAALLNVLIANHGEGRARVETKTLNASDRSSSTAGDVQVMVGARVLEAFEVTANNWRTKVSSASKTIRDNDLSRLHIVAERSDKDRAEVETTLQSLAEDVSVLDTRQIVEVLVAVLTRPQRAEALVRLYEYLDRYQPDTNRVNLLVERLGSAGLVER